MDLTRELAKLSNLHQTGALTGEEYAAAKARLIGGAWPASRHDAADASLGRAANRYVSFAIVMSIIGLVVFVIMAMTMFKRSEKSAFRIDPKAIKFSAAPAVERPLLRR